MSKSSNGSLVGWLKSFFRGASRPSQARPTSRLKLETLEGREVPTTVPILYAVGGLAYPGQAVNYVTQNQANLALNQAQRTQLAQVANLYNPGALQQAGLSAGLAFALSDAAKRAAVAPSLLDAHPASPAEFNAAITRLRVYANNVNYVLSPSGYRSDLLIVGGYGDLTKVSAYRLGQLALQDPLISLLSGNLTTQVTQAYINRYYTNGSTTYVNGVGILNAGRSRPSAAWAAVAESRKLEGKVQAIGGLGGSRPLGTGTGSPFVDALLGYRI